MNCKFTLLGTCLLNRVFVHFTTNKCTFLKFVRPQLRKRSESEACLLEGFARMHLTVEIMTLPPESPFMKAKERVEILTCDRM